MTQRTKDIIKCGSIVSVDPDYFEEDDRRHRYFGEVIRLVGETEDELRVKWTDNTSSLVQKSLVRKEPDVTNIFEAESNVDNSIEFQRADRVDCIVNSGEDDNNGNGKAKKTKKAKDVEAK